MTKELLELQLKGKTAVYVDWANVYGWKKSLKKEVNPTKLFRYVKKYKNVKEVYFYFGTDVHPKSKKFIAKVKRTGYEVITKPVKHIFIAEVNGKKIYKRKCDFDMEICIDVHRLLTQGFESFIFFTGDGDFEALYKLLISKHAQVIVVYARGHLGREIWDLKKGIFKIELPRFMPL